MRKQRRYSYRVTKSKFSLKFTLFFTLYKTHTYYHHDSWPLSLWPINFLNFWLLIVGSDLKQSETYMKKTYTTMWVCSGLFVAPCPHPFALINLLHIPIFTCMKLGSCPFLSTHKTLAFDGCMLFMKLLSYVFCAFYGSFISAWVESCVWGISRMF